MRDLAGKVAWVTGAGSGIGEAAARALLAAGMQVVLSGRSKEKLEGVAADSGALVMPLDVADRAAVQRTAGAIVERFGALHLLVSSAGINVNQRNWHNVTVEDWDRVIRINLDGAFYCAHAVLPQMVQQGDGLIINISSWAGKHVGSVTGPAYTAAKHAMNAMNESINVEAGIHGVRACAVCPGEVSTPILDARPIPVSAEERKRMVQAQDCGEVVRFLAELPPHVCINELTISPTYNRAYAAQAKALQPG